MQSASPLQTAGLPSYDHPSPTLSQSTATMVSSDITRVLILYTGGTIGMKNTVSSGFKPVANYLTEHIASMNIFHDPTYFNQQHEGRVAMNPVNIPIRHDIKSHSNVFYINGTPCYRSTRPAMITPKSWYGKRTRYSILEYDPLLDSSNMSKWMVHLVNIAMSDWAKIATDIEVNYTLYDAFLVLHGTDTMAYTASALSFMLEDLGKTVILTGSQIPLSELRNDAIDNLLGALTIVGHFVIPEVGLFFAHKLFRGNRSSKVDAMDFKAFDSPNMKPLVTVGIDINVSWQDVQRPTAIARFKAHKLLNPSVSALRMFPGITEATVRAFLAPPIRGVVLLTYGAGNAPNNRPELLAAFKEACDRGVIIVNCTQCNKGRVSDSYETGKALLDIGIVPGSDMTPECALTKLSYLLGKNYSPEECRSHVKRNLRGELTVSLNRKQFTYQYTTQGLITSVLSILKQSKTAGLMTPRGLSFADSVMQAPPPLDLTSPTLPMNTTGYSSVQSPTSTSPPTGYSPTMLPTSPPIQSAKSYGTSDEQAAMGLDRSLVPMMLCYASRVGDVHGLQSVLSEFGNTFVNLTDYDGRTPLHVACSEGHLAVVEYLLCQGAIVHLRDRYNHCPLWDAITSNNMDVVKLLRQAGAHFSEEQSDDITTALLTAAAQGDLSKFKMLVYCGVDLNRADREGRTSLHVALEYYHYFHPLQNESDLSHLIKGVYISKSASNTSISSTSSHVSMMGHMMVQLNARDRWGKTPLQEAKLVQCEEIIELLEKGLKSLGQ